MIYSVESHDPDNYNTIEIHPQLHFVSSSVKYYINAINTFSNFLITTANDYIKIKCGDDTSDTFKFQNKREYADGEIINDLNSRLKSSGIKITLSIMDDGRVKFYSPDKKFSIINMTHRVKYLLGFYDTAPADRASGETNIFPIEAVDDNGADFQILSNGVPQLCFGNVLYLRSIQGYGMGKENYVAPICCRINTFLKSGLPIIINKKQDKIITDFDAVAKIRLELVDRYMVPVILKSPLHVDLTFKPFYAKRSEHKRKLK